MSTYRALKGYSIKSVSSDPSNPKEGQIWYNNSAMALKIRPTIQAFSSGGTIHKIVRGGGSGGTQTAAWIAGGLQYPGDTKNKTWTYDGSSWTAGNNLPANYFIGGSTAPDSAGLIFDGHASYGPGTAT